MESPAVEHDKTVDVTVRITPLSLLFTSILGTVLLGIVLIAGLRLVPFEAWLLGREAPASLFPPGPGLLLAFGVLLSVLFWVGYRRHGRRVPTEARAWDNTLAVAVPDAWGKLIRDELYLEKPYRKTLPSTERSDTGANRSADSAAQVDEDLVMLGVAQEWWDPGTYEVYAAPEAADVLQREMSPRSAQPDGSPFDECA